MMLDRLINFIKRPTSLNVIVNTLGNYLNVFFTAFFALILVRILSPAQYGVLSVLLGIAYVLANMLDFGTTATIYSNLPALFEKRAENMYRFIKSTFFFQSLFSTIVIGILFITFPFLDKVFFKTKAPLSELYLTAISVLFFIWQNFFLNVLFAVKKFVRANLYLNLSNLIKTAVIFVLVFTKGVTVGTVIFVFGILGPVIFFVLLFTDKKYHIPAFLTAKVRKEEIKFGYTFTYFIASQFFNLGMRMDLFLLSFFGLRIDVGFYGLSQKIVLTIITTVVSITQVLSPVFSQYQSLKDIRHHFKTGFLYMLVPTGLFLALFFMPAQIYTLVFTDRFAPTAAITKALSLPFIIYTLGSLPMLFILYTVKKPKYILVANVIFFITVTGGCALLIPKYGVFGPPVAILIALTLATGILTGASIYEYRRLGVETERSDDRIKP